MVVFCLFFEKDSISLFLFFNILQPGIQCNRYNYSAGTELYKSRPTHVQAVLVAIETIPLRLYLFVYIIQREYTPRIFTVLRLSNQKRYNLNVYY